MTRNKVLLIAPSYDVHAAAVVYGLRKNQIADIWVPNIPSLKEITVSACRNSWGATLGTDCDASSIVSAWFRRPGGSELASGCAPCDEKFVRHEWAAFQRNIFDMAEYLSETFWINNPTAARRAESKLLQLRVASDVGLPYPPAIVSNSPDAVKSFISKHEVIILKPFTPHTWTNQNSGSQFTNYAAMLTADSEIEDASIGICPSIYQKYVDKIYDVRATLIGDKIYAYKIRGVNGDPLLDWRMATDVQTEVCSLPHTIERKVKALQKRLNIAFGCADFVVDRDGNAYFLEINQGGQFLFMEENERSLPLLRAFCAMLMEGRPDYCLDTCKPVSFEEFKKSEYQHQWREQVRDVELVNDKYCSADVV